MDIFDKVTPTMYAPYIRFNSVTTKRHELFKLYTGRSLEERPDYSKVVPPFGGKEKDNTFTFTVWSGRGDVSKATKDSFIQGIYDLNNNEIIQELDKKFSSDEIIEGSRLSLQNLYERENGLGDKNPVDVKIHGYIKENYKKVKLFHTLNHPCNLLLNYYSFKICEHIKNYYYFELNPYNNDFDKGYEKLGSTTIPIYKKIKSKALQTFLKNSFTKF